MIRCLITALLLVGCTRSNPSSVEPQQDMTPAAMVDMAGAAIPDMAQLDGAASADMTTSAPVDMAHAAAADLAQCGGLGQPCCGSQSLSGTCADAASGAVCWSPPTGLAGSGSFTCETCGVHSPRNISAPPPCCYNTGYYCPLNNQSCQVVQATGGEATTECVN